MIYITFTKSHLIFISLLLLCIIMDLGQFFSAGAVKIPLILSLYSSVLLYNNYTFCLFVALLQCLETFCFYNSFFLALFSVIPLYLCALFFQRNLYPCRLHALILTFLGIIIQIYAIEGCFLSVWPSVDYTIMRISATLLITICFSLTLNIKGVKDNRA